MRLCQKMRSVGWLVCFMLAATFLLIMIAEHHGSKSYDGYISVHTATAMPPLRGFSSDSVVNSGDAKALDALPGVGEVIAQRIIDARAMLGGFRLPEDLMLVKGIGEKTLAKIMEALQEPLIELNELQR